MMLHRTLVRARMTIGAPMSASLQQLRWRKVTPRVQEAPVRDIPENEYLYGFTATELKDAPESIRRVLQARNGSEREILHWRIQKCIEHFGKSPSDTGNTSVQIAVDTVKIDNMIEHMKNHGKDKSAIRVMQRLVYHRRSMMRYLKRTDIEEYVRVLKELGLPDAVEAPPKFRIKKLMKK